MSEPIPQGCHSLSLGVVQPLSLAAFAAFHWMNNDSVIHLVPYGADLSAPFSFHVLSSGCPKFFLVRILILRLILIARWPLLLFQHLPQHQELLVS